MRIKRIMPNGDLLYIDGRHAQGLPMQSYAESSNRPSWLIRAGIRTGLLMSAPPPKVWTLNPSVVTLLIVIASLIASGGYYIGHQAAVIEGIQRQADKAASDAATVKNLVSEEVEPSPTPVRKEKR